LLYATYWLRVMRLGGHVAEPTFDAVRAILETNGFPQIADVAGMLYRDDEAEIYRYLSQRRDRFMSPPDDDVAQSIEIDRPAAPKISVIVSVYNGAGKADTFVSGVERLTAAEKAITEFIFVDSASVDDTGSVLPERLRRAAARGIGSLYIRSHERETIQRAWNRGIAAARGEYLAFLGVDEMNRPDSLATMAAFLDRRHDIDWVQGSAVITEVNEAGSYVRDVMAYDRTFDSQHIHYLECCYISYVGALYRKSIHRRVGFYDDNFRAAGDTEFKNRALPFIRVATLPETFGTFLNYPEARTTQSPTAELEDMAAWHLHRSAAGVRYALEARDPDDCAGQFRRALHYKKSYMDRICTDVEYAWNIAQYLRRHRPDAFTLIEHFVPNLLGLRIAYERFDDPVNPEFNPGAKGLEAIGGALEHVWFGIAQAYTVHKGLGLPAQYDPRSDNRWHQHHLLWPSTTRRATAEEPAATDRELPAGAHQLAGDEQLPFLAGAAAAPAAVTPFEIELFRPIGGSGWYDSEGSAGNWYRWTGPQPRFVLEVLLSQDHAYRCDMTMAPVRPHVADNLSITVNDAKVDHQEEWKGETLHLSFPIRDTLSQSTPDFCRIVFRHKAVYSPGQDGGADARRLGFAVRSILFSPLSAEPDTAATAYGGADLEAGIALSSMPAPAGLDQTIAPLPPAVSADATRGAKGQPRAAPRRKQRRASA
jgi:glycosyltransferase involved in cell wall biosynthesis